MENQPFGSEETMPRTENGAIPNSGDSNTRGGRMEGMGGFDNRRGFEQNPYVHPNASAANSRVQNPYYRVNEPLQQAPSDTAGSLLGTFDTENFLKGALIGAIGAYLLTNEKAQKAIFKTVAKGTQMFQAGMEEMKERFEDAKAELEAEQ